MSEHQDNQTINDVENGKLKLKLLGIVMLCMFSFTIGRVAFKADEVRDDRHKTSRMRADSEFFFKEAEKLWGCVVTDVETLLENPDAGFTQAGIGSVKERLKESSGLVDLFHDEEYQNQIKAIAKPEELRSSLDWPSFNPGVRLEIPFDQQAIAIDSAAEKDGSAPRVPLLQPQALFPTLMANLKANKIFKVTRLTLPETPALQNSEDTIYLLYLHSEEAPQMVSLVMSTYRDNENRKWIVNFEMEQEGL